ncbi:hypothetical protein HPP92_010411 [Vanilla planifolia]|uniref:Uncharacterized protein n=1 Tax=Vanilla planifolia TaxID=51239 RepID=A0A835R9C0_VANPL|nr:hypothetical protein HPP92_010411 [Vanilla planifolia]
MGSRASSAPKQRSPTSGNAFDVQSQSKGATETMRSSSSGSNLNVKRVSTATNIVDDLSSIFGGNLLFGGVCSMCSSTVFCSVFCQTASCYLFFITQSSEDFKEVEGESEDRRRQDWRRHQRTVEKRCVNPMLSHAKALAEKNERDMQLQREQEEIHVRIWIKVGQSKASLLKGSAEELD